MKEKLLKGSKKIMFSAPHCVEHKRDGKIKVREINTDTLVIQLNKRKKVAGIIKVESTDEDVNWDEKSEYKNKCIEYIQNNDIKFFIDIHGMDYKRKQDICIGTANTKNIMGRIDIVEDMKKVFKKYGYNNVTIDEPFSADNVNCVSTFVRNTCNIISFQIEINNKYRFIECKEYNMENLINCFEKIVDTLNEYI